MTFSSGVYKLFETADSQIYRLVQPETAIPKPAPVVENADKADMVVAEVGCGSCGERLNIQANLRKGLPLKEGAVKFPKTNTILCPKCNANIDLSETRRQIEAMTKKTIVE